MTTMLAPSKLMPRSTVNLDLGNVETDHVPFCLFFHNDGEKSMENLCRELKSRFEGISLARPILAPGRAGACSRRARRYNILEKGELGQARRVPRPRGEHGVP